VYVKVLVFVIYLNDVMGCGLRDMGSICEEGRVENGREIDAKRSHSGEPKERKDVPCR